jgi:hypothetical protein
MDWQRSLSLRVIPQPLDNMRPEAMSIFLTDDEILRVGLLDLIAKNWPDLVEN